MSLGQIIAGLKYGINSTIGTDNFTPLDQLIKGQSIDLSSVADKSTHDSIKSVLGTTSDTGGVFTRQYKR